MIRLHLGAHKTASTHLQQTLRPHRARLARAGLVWLDPRDLRAAPLDPSAAAETGAPGGAAALVGAAGVEALLSEENLLGSAHERGMWLARRLYPRAGARLANLLAATGWHGVGLFMAVRDPAAFLVSAYAQRLYAGQVTDFATFLDGLDPVLLRWSDLAARLVAVPGVAGLTVWRHEDYPAILSRLLPRMLPDDLGAGIRPLPQVVHPGLSAAAHAEVLARIAAGQPGAGLARALRTRYPKSDAWPGYQPFDATARAASATAYCDDLARLARLDGVTLLTPG